MQQVLGTKKGARKFKACQSHLSKTNQDMQTNCSTLFNAVAVGAWKVFPASAVGQFASS